MPTNATSTLLDEFREAMAYEPKHRLLHFVASLGASLWCLAPVLWPPQEPPLWYFLAAFGPMTAYLIVFIPRKARLLRDQRFLPIRNSFALQAKADIVSIWPNEAQASQATWQRPLLGVGWVIFGVCAVVGIVASVPMLMG